MFNTLAADIFNARLAQAHLILMLNCQVLKVTANKSKHLLVESELEKLKTFHSSYFIDKSHFVEDGKQNYLVFWPL